MLADLTPGVRPWASSLDVAYVRGVVRRSGRRFGHVAGAQVHTVAGLHEALADALALPDYYGRNLDALADCLGDLLDAPVLLWDDWGPLASAEPRVVRVALELLHDSRVTTLLRGDGPDDVLPELTPRAG